MTRPEVLEVLARLKAVGAALSLTPDGAGLRVLGKGRPAPDVLAEVKAHKPALLAYLRGEDAAKVERPAADRQTGPGAAQASLPTLPPLAAWGTGEEKAAGDAPPGPAPFLPSPEDRHAAADLPDLGDRPTRPALTPEEWAAEAAQAGRCGSCARAVPAPDWGPLMVSCGADPVAWWPLPAPFAVHIGAKCGAYLLPGEEIGQGYRSREAAQTWGSGQAIALPPAAKRPA